MDVCVTLSASVCLFLPFQGTRSLFLFWKPQPEATGGTAGDYYAPPTFTLPQTNKTSCPPITQCNIMSLVLTDIGTLRQMARVIKPCAWDKMLPLVKTNGDYSTHRSGSGLIQFDKTWVTWERGREDCWLQEADINRSRHPTFCRAV